MELIKQGGAWYTLKFGSGAKFQKTEFADYAGELLMEAEKQTTAILSVSETVEEDMNEKETAKSRRKKKATGEE
jgi:hypothetical protein